MIAYIKGEVAWIEEERIVLESGNIGYNIMMPASSFDTQDLVGKEVKIYTHLNVREDAMQLYGFLNLDELKTFRLLLGVNGIGPKAALGILSDLTTDELRFAVLSDDVKTISKAPGIGKKTAQKLILELKDKIDSKVVELEKVAAMSAREAKEELFKQVEQQISLEMSAYIKEQEEEAKSKAADMSRDIIANAINRYAQEEVTERTVTVVDLPSEEMKGRIIGREGRNIKAIEQATGADLIIDDTPEAITISCFDPVRREVARLSLETLIRDGRIQPGRIEEVVDKTRKE